MSDGTSVSGELHTVRYLCPSCDFEHQLETSTPILAANSDLAVHVGEAEVFGDGPCSPTAVIDGEPHAFDPEVNALV